MKILFKNKENKYHLNVDFSVILGDWADKLELILDSTIMSDLMFFLNETYKKSFLLYPEKKNIFKPFILTPYKDVEIVIVDCRPVFSKRSNGLAFGNKDSIREEDFNSSLITMFNEIEQKDYKGVMVNKDYTLESWASKGILLLNSYLTSYEIISHRFQWFNFICYVLGYLSDNRQGLIFIFIGEDKNMLYSRKINEKKHTILNYDKFDYNVLEELNSNIEYINGKNCRIKW